MSATYLDCPRCGWELKIGDDLVGKSVTCPKCKETFVAEVGGSYDLADAPASPLLRAPADAGPSATAPRRPGPSQPRPGPAPKPKGVDPELESLMDRWAEE